MYDYAVHRRMNVLVHCKQGANRSMGWMIGFFMATCRLTFDEAFGHVHRLRRITAVESTGPGFQTSGKEFLVDMTDRLHTVLQDIVWGGFLDVPTVGGASEFLLCYEEQKRLNPK